MKNLIIAWRNLWRNRRRTLITAAAVFFAVWFALIFRSLQLGSYGHMFKSVIESYTGYIQVQHKDFWEEKIVDNTFFYDKDLDSTIMEVENVIATIPRFESFALASSGPLTKGVMVMGIDIDKESYLSKVDEKLVQYRLDSGAVFAISNYVDLNNKIKNRLKKKIKKNAVISEGNSYSTASRLQLDLGIPDRKAGLLMPKIKEFTAFENGYIKMGEPGVWVGDRLSRYLKLGIGDTIVLISQGYHATTAAGKYEIKGIIKQPVPDLDSRIVYLPLEICQELYNAPGNLTSLALHIDDNSNNAIAITVNRLNPLMPEDNRVIEWREMNEILVSQLEADDKSGKIMIGILYLVIAFAVFGTVLMMTVERRREFGVLVAIGMQKRKLCSVISFEMFFIGLIGILAGSMMSIPIILVGQSHPIVFKGEMGKMFEEYGMEAIMPFQGIDAYFLWQIAIVAIMVFLALLYPLRKIYKLKVVTALRV